MSFRIKKYESSNKTIRMPNSLIDEMEKLASKHGISFNKLVVQCCLYSLKHLEEEDALNCKTEDVKEEKAADDPD